MSDACAWVMDPSTTIIVPGVTWNPGNPESDIRRIEFRAWSLDGQLVEALPLGKLYYLPNGIPLLFPVNTLWSTCVPIYLASDGSPILACEYDLTPRFEEEYTVTWENAFPQDPVLRTVGGAIDIYLHGGFHRTLISTKATGKSGNTRPVNAFIAYRCHYAPHIPVGKQMDVSGIIRKMWAAESQSIKAKFTNAAKTFTIERDQQVKQGYPKIALKQYMAENYARFGIMEPREDFIEKFMSLPGSSPDCMVDEYDIEGNVFSETSGIEELVAGLGHEMHTNLDAIDTLDQYLPFSSQLGSQSNDSSVYLNDWSHTNTYLSSQQTYPVIMAT